MPPVTKEIALEGIRENLMFHNQGDFDFTSEIKMWVTEAVFYGATAQEIADIFIEGLDTDV